MTENGKKSDMVKKITFRKTSGSKYVLIKAVKCRKGGWMLVDDWKTPVDEGYCYPTRTAAYGAAHKYWPSNSVWKGKKISGGYRITI